LLGEALVHGYDIACAEGLPWTIEPAHAILALEGLEPVMVHFVDREAAAGLATGFEIQLRGGSTSYWYFDQRGLTVETSPIRPVDCHIAAEPISFLLMSYNRIGPTKPALTGKVRVWGRRPWLATRLGGIFKT
jgi:putative sterol carrier protein